MVETGIDDQQENVSVHKAAVTESFPIDNEDLHTKSLKFKMPRDYPQLETPLNIFLPLHFTNTDVEFVHERGDPSYDAFHSIHGTLIDQCNAIEPPVACMPGIWHSAHYEVVVKGS